AQETGHDASLSHATYARHRHNQLAVEAPHSATFGCSEDEISCTVEPPRVLFGLEAEDAGTRRPVNPHLLDPRQVAGADQAVRDRIHTSHELVPEPQHGAVSVLVVFEHFGLAQVGKGESE